MTHFVTLDLSNNITGLYTDEPGYANPPATAMPISDLDAAVLRGGFSGYQLLAGAVQPMPTDFAELKIRAAAIIDAKSGIARAKYITVAPGQEATYLLKAQQAAAYKAAGYSGTVPGLVQAEIDATGATAQAAADSILAQEAAWSVIAAQIESARRRGKVAVAGCINDDAAISAACDVAVAELKLL